MSASPDDVEEKIKRLAAEMREQADRGAELECRRILLELTALVPGQKLPPGVLPEFYECLRIATRWYPQVWVSALEIAEALHTAQSTPDTAAWYIEALRMNGRHETAHEVALDSIQRHTITPPLLLQVAAAYAVVGDEERARRFLAAGAEHGCPVAEMVAKEPTLHPLRGLV